MTSPNTAAAISAASPSKGGLGKVRLDEERSDKLAMQSIVMQTARARTSVRDTPPPLPPQQLSSPILNPIRDSLRSSQSGTLPPLFYSSYMYQPVVFVKQVQTPPTPPSKPNSPPPPPPTVCLVKVRLDEALYNIAKDERRVATALYCIAL